MVKEVLYENCFSKNVKYYLEWSIKGTYTTLADRWGDFRNQIDRFLVSLTEKDLFEEINYKNLSGISYSLELWKQMLHVNNHSTSHRGQVVTMLRQLKKQPPSLDLIYYYLGER
ncbi:DinB family protein [Desulfosporosinus lacus]|uniref:DinB family protein n=1 Tax=Desulfosporosinus lacus DSM 15449 TaxID=1121420 RepID=A0A1M6BKT7_9FIRM|nr:DinB family protein [Desulfosporosinus lacus]SHI49188.1 DinB family protein [Desulfosporosinus lacus DSM 15449]